MSGHELYLQPVTLRQAQAFIRQHHRHNPAPRGWIMGTSVRWRGRIVGVMTVGRPARMAQDGFTAELTRCAIDPLLHSQIEAEIGFKPPVASMLYGAARRAVKALGYRRLLTKCLDEESGASIAAAGFEFIGMSDGGSWDRLHRRREDKSDTGPKKRWALDLAA